MPTGITPADRKLLIIGGALLVLMLVASAILAPPNEREGSAIPSSYSAQSGGALAAYLLLNELEYPVRRWEESPTELGGASDEILLILADPLQPPSEKERQALSQFVKRGGHVLFTGSNVGMFFRDAQLSPEIPAPDWKTISPAMPSRLTPGAQHIVMQAEAYWGRLNELQLPLYGDSNATAAVSWKLGKGEILWWAGPTPLTNAGITRDDNLAFFLNSVIGTAQADLQEIYWDEYFHGQRSSLWSYVQKTSLPWGILQLGLLAFAVLFSFSRRRGPLYVPAEISRLSPLEFVDTLAGLYERAGAAGSALSVSYQRLRSVLTRQLSVPGATPDSELGLIAEQRFGWAAGELAPLLVRTESSAREARLRPHEALKLIQQLESYVLRLGVRPQFRLEKN